MNVAGIGSLVKISYIISLEDGIKVEQDKTSKPLSFKIGSGKVFQKLEEGVVGMQVNEKRRIPVSAADGYGKYKKELVLRLERKVFPEDIKLIPGRTVQYQNRDGERVNFIVNEVTEKTVTVDGNHPLAGLDLVYEVELLEIQ
ncbi:MAG: FKBP-type peptidyl-prolyl cis-trans isomerase [Proteobacteria bacterium]|nr:FKBP-type peptidyl-prolyl cis-trans isomerase [Pseudomonadota bacterium]